MGRWKLIRPAAARNLVTNPSFEVAIAGWSDYLTGEIDAAPPPVGTVGSVYGQRVGYIGLTAGSGDGAYYAITLSPATKYYLKMKVGAFIAFVVKVAIVRTDTSAEVASETITLPRLIDNGYRFSDVEFDFTTPATTGFRLLITHVSGSGAFAYFMIDGVQISLTDAIYIDGDQPECVWEGIPHQSVSRTRLNAPTSRAVGTLVDFRDDYRFYVNGDGVGMARLEWGVSPRPAPAPGSPVSSVRVPGREVALSGVLVGDDYVDLRERRNTIISDVAPDLVPYVAGVPQPVALRYVGDYKTLELLVDYLEGLEQSGNGVQAYTERIALRFAAHDDPYWREIGDTTGTVDNSDSISVYGVSARLAGLWSALGITALSGAGEVRAVAWGPDGKLYFGGDFAQVNAVSNTAYIARYSPGDGSIEALTTTPLNGAVNALFFTPDHTLYVGGEFTNAGGDADADYVCWWLDTIWGGSAIWVTLTGDPLDDVVRCLALNALNGRLLIGGDFTSDGVTTLNYVCSYDGSAFLALGSGLDGAVRAIAQLNNGRYTIMVGGDFANAGGAAAPYLACYEASAWYAVGESGPNGAVHTIAAWDDGAIVGGAFTTMDGETVNYVMQLSSVASTYTGFRALGDGSGATVRAVTVYDGFVYAALNTTNRRIGIWNGNAWLIADTGVASGATVYALAVNIYGELAYGGDSAGATTVPGDTTTTLPRGAAETFPVVTVKRTGGTFVYLKALSNETLKQAIFMDTIALLDGETITIDCKTLSITSSFGRPLAALPGSSPMALRSGDNEIVLLAPGDGIVTAAISYRPRYWSYDAAEDAE